MREKLPLAISIAALVVALGVGTPAVARTIVDYARNADKVDGFHAAAKPRPGRLLALNGNAKFPAAAVPAPFGATFSKNVENFAGCETKDIISEAITVKRRSTIFVIGEVTHWIQAVAGSSAAIRVELRDGTGTVVAQTWDALQGAPQSTTNAKLRIVVSGVLGPFPTTTATPYVAEPGTYTLVLHGGPSDLACVASNETVMDRIDLTYVLMRPTQ
jgi:hypothetical protein